MGTLQSAAVLHCSSCLNSCRVFSGYPTMLTATPNLVETSFVLYESYIYIADQRSGHIYLVALKLKRRKWIGNEESVPTEIFEQFLQSLSCINSRSKLENNEIKKLPVWVNMYHYLFICLYFIIFDRNINLCSLYWKRTWLMACF